MHVTFYRPGIPRLHDNEIIHCTRPNTNSFQRGNKNYTLHPLTEEDPNSSKHNKVSGFLTTAKFEVQKQDMGVMYAQVFKVGKEVPTFKFDDYPPKIHQLLWDFKKLVSNEFPQRLPPMRSIQHAIYLVLGAAFPNLPAF